VYEVKGLPILINDIPDYFWRGLMIDTSRHFMSVELIKKTINAMMFLKLNALHWHIVDQESFPLFVPNRP
jgi:hexosaminidase